MEGEQQVQALSAGDGVIHLKNFIPVDKQSDVCAQLLNGKPVDWTKFEGDQYYKNPFMAFSHLFQIRWPKSNSQEPGLPILVSGLSLKVHEGLYGPGGIFAGLPENGCSEDHQGRPCQCPDKTPFFPRSTLLNCVEALVYRTGSKRAYHRDAHWIVGLSFGCEVVMGFRRHEDSEEVTVRVASGEAVVFNGALHSHAVLSISEGTAPDWWKYPFARAVFLMRDYRQSLKAEKRKEARRKAALEAGKAAAEIATKGNDAIADL